VPGGWAGLEVLDPDFGGERTLFSLFKEVLPLRCETSNASLSASSSLMSSVTSRTLLLLCPFELRSGFAEASLFFFDDYLLTSSASLVSADKALSLYFFLAFASSVASSLMSSTSSSLRLLEEMALGFF